VKVGILGGTFDPVHKGHLALAGTALKQLGLDRVLFVPAGDPWMKTGKRRVTAAEHRLAMLRLALKGKPGFEISTVDLERPGKTYAVDTVAAIKKTLPKGSQVYFIVGAGSLSELPLWKAPARLIRMCRMVVAPRPGYRIPELAELEREVYGITGRVALLDMKPVDVSSSQIRERVKSGHSVGKTIPEDVGRYIKRHRLYEGY